MLAFGEDSYQAALHQFAISLPKPTAVVILSAHSVSSDQIHVLSTEQNRIQHDFAGFPRPLYDIRYPCAGSPALASEVASLFLTAGFKVKTDTDAPLDHGIWVPLLHLYPKGDVPIVRVSLPLNLMPAQILKMGHTLAPLREKGVLIIGSGGAVHNLGELQWSGKSTEGETWAKAFESWLITSLQNKNVEALVHFEDHPEFLRAHPSSEHFLPLLFTVGCTLAGDELSLIFKGIEYGTLSMLCFSLNPPTQSTFH